MSLMRVESGPDQMILQLFGDVTWARARHFNPRLGKDGAHGRHEQNVQNRVNRVHECCTDGPRRRNVISETGRGGKLGGFLHWLGTQCRSEQQRTVGGQETYLPNTENFDEKIIREA
jgi:hypothetical protein